MEQEEISIKLRRYHLRHNDNKVEIFFSSIDYDDKVYNDTESLAVSDLKLTQKMLLAGIAKPKPFFDYLQTDKDEVMVFSDHHHFTESDILNINSQANNKIIVTTEKDFVRLEAKILRKQLFYLPIKSKFLSNQESFDTIILNYVGASTRNR
jgi:tetraacyldisaccharide 4'-kinase